MESNKLTAEDIFNKYFEIDEPNEVTLRQPFTLVQSIRMVMNELATQELADAKAEIERLQSELTQLKASKEPEAVDSWNELYGDIDFLAREAGGSVDFGLPFYGRDEIINKLKQGYSIFKQSKTK